MLVTGRTGGVIVQGVDTMAKAFFSFGLLLTVFVTVGCSSKAGNVAVGAGAAGAVYEYSNKRSVDKLDEDVKAGKITREEYDRRRKEIEDKSLVY